jgi:hypothetical protein
MKKLSNLAGMLLLFLFFNSCQKQEDLVLSNETAVVEETANTTKLKSVSTTALSYMNTLFNVDFSKNKVGSYSKSLWYADWNSPYWANSAIGYGKIEANGSNKYLKEVFPAGTFLLTGAGTQWEAKFDKGYDELYLTYKVKFSKGFANITTMVNYLALLVGNVQTQVICQPVRMDGQPDICFMVRL